MDKLTSSLSTVENLVRCVKKWGAHPNAWLEAVTGRRLHGDLKRNIEELLAIPAGATSLVDSLSPTAIIALALVTENDGEWPYDLYDLELGRIIGPSRVTPALEELTSRGLSFEGKAQDGWTVHRTRVLPEVLKTWLRPELDGLLQATDDLDEIAEAAPLSHGLFDPSLDLAFVLAAVATVRPRITLDDGRLFARERTKLAAMLGQRDSSALDGLVSQLTACGLLLANRDQYQPRLETHWPVVAEWSALSAAERVRLQLAPLLESGAGRTILAANGAWVPERRMRRQHMMTRVGYLPAKRDALAGALDEVWGSVKSTVESWTEVEVSSRDGVWAARLRPQLGVALSGGTCPSAKLHVQASFEVLVPREAALADVVLVARVADLVKVDTVATFRITRDSARRAVMSGLALDEIDAALNRAAAFGVPESVARSLRDFVGSMGRSTVRRAMLVEFDNVELANKAAGLLGDDARLVAPTIFEVAPALQGRVLKKLDRAGMSPRDAGAILRARSEAQAPADDSDDWESDDDLDDDLDDDPEDWSDPYSRPGQSPADRFAAVMKATRTSWPALTLGLHLPPARIAAVRAARKQAQSELGEPPGPKTGKEIAPRPHRDAPTDPFPPRQPDDAAIARPPASQIERLGPLAISPERIRRTLGLAAVIDAEVAAVTSAGQSMRFRPIAVDDSSTPTVRSWREGAVTSLPLADLAQVAMVPASARRLGRNQPCPCESGRKFKRCCGAHAAAR